MNEVSTSTLNDMCELIVDCPHFTPDWTQNGFVVIRNQNIRDGRLDLTNPSYTHREDFDRRIKRAKPKAYDIIFTREAPMGEVCMIPNNLECCIGQRQVLLRPKKDVNARYLFFALRSSYVRHQIFWNEGTGSTVSNVRIPVLEVLKIPRLGNSEKKIGDLLGSLDDKIELNRQMNETLEATARLFFKDWFVDFGPTRAKAEGRPAYLAPDLWSLFPDALDDDDKPIAWETSTIGQEVRVVGGTTPSTKEPTYWNGEFCWATPKDLSSLKTPVLLSTERRITQAGISQIGSGLLPIGTVLLSSRAPIGYLVISQVETAVNQGFIAMVCEEKLSNVFVWLWTQSNMEVILQKANGSTFQEISKSNFRPIQVIVADRTILLAFDEITQPLYKQIVANEQESRTLAQTRDLLLPKLMSGEIRLRDAEKIAGQAL